MVNLSIKDVPEELAEQLRRRASANHRSLQGELMSIITQAVSAQAPAPRPKMSIDQIAAELERRFPGFVDDKSPRSVDIIREMRDSR